MAYFILTETNIMDYIDKNVQLREILKDGSLRVKEIGDGNVNFVFKVENLETNITIIIKQAVPYLRCDGQLAMLDKTRLKQEYLSLQCYGEIVPENIPQIFLYDDEMCLLAMEYIDNGVLKLNLLQNKLTPDLADQISTFLANIYIKTSLFAMENKEFKQLQQKIVANTELIALTEKYVFTVPYFANNDNFADLNIKNIRDEIYNNWEIKSQILQLKYKFLTSTESLIHGDLHTGSIMLDSNNKIKIIDSEFAMFGPTGFDLGQCSAHLIISYIANCKKANSIAILEWHLSTIVNIYEMFQNKCLNLCRNMVKVSGLNIAGFSSPEQFKEFLSMHIDNIITDAFGYAAIEIMRRQLGGVGTPEIKDLPLEARNHIKSVLINIAKEMLLNRDKITPNELPLILKRHYI